MQEFDMKRLMRAVCLKMTKGPLISETSSCSLMQSVSHVTPQRLVPP